MLSSSSIIRRSVLTGLTGLLLLAQPSCKSVPSNYLHPNADIAAITKVAVLPFETLTQDRAAGEKVQRIFLVELLSLGVFEVVEPGQVAGVIRSERIESTEALGPADLKRIGEALQAQGLFLGTVIDYGDAGGGGGMSAPQVTIQLRLVETQSGVTVWTTSQSKSGATTASRLLGIGGMSLTEASRLLVRQELKTLLQ